VRACVRVHVRACMRAHACVYVRVYVCLAESMPYEILSNF